MLRLGLNGRQFRFALLCFSALGTIAVGTTESQAQNSGLVRYSLQQRAEIRAMPILERPNRTLHFYGNAVRRNAQPTSAPSSSSADLTLMKTEAQPQTSAPVSDRAKTSVPKASSKSNTVQESDSKETPKGSGFIIRRVPFFRGQTAKLPTPPRSN